ncbi:autotransporter outer membrane beta-barrel domain-containing protein [Entomomonas moraniae]|uniref:Autotransporter outer membrane beta-barrel domain-containing protein n=1 Tax=Entomomonas moraniae TaxID=2213226 RepID=A0A3S9XF11_9GAMM|nr:autotransporter outer membrane beta-barrel domain-containing protein [Entomomonas moraniae]AZS51053.1 autotransporter outer membrane beta-barrel domain-containing protein [Entomomonas moraniae]
MFDGKLCQTDPDYKVGSGTAKSFGAGANLTYLDYSGFYFDTVLKYTNVRNKFSVKDTQNNAVQGRTKSKGYGLSFEFGKQFKLGDSHFYIEPQFQLAYQYQDGDKSNATNGLEIKMDSYDSLLGRASGIVGYKMAESKSLQLNLYVKTGIVQEFAGDTSYRLNGNKGKYSFSGAWFDNGIGLNAKINDRHTIYGELGCTAGQRFDKMQASVGYRFQF